MIVGIDIDGVLRDIYKPLLKALKTKFPNKYFPPVEHWKHYEIWKDFEITETQSKILWFNSTWTSYIYTCAPNYPDAMPFLTQLKDKDRVIKLISSSPNRQIMGCTIEWLSRIDSFFDELHFTQYGKKGEVFCDYYVEDSPHEIEKILEHNNFKKIFMVRRPWNEKYEGKLPGIVVPVNKLTHILEYI